MAVPGHPEIPERLAVGAHLSHYEITGKIGEGGMGAVYKAVDLKLGRTVALKVISRLSITADDRRRFSREANAASHLNHPNIITIYEYDSIDGVDFIAMEYIEGQTLDQHLAFDTDPNPLPARLDWMRQVASALAAAHAAGIVHRDLKPANIMITAAGQVKVLDFGLSKRETNVDDKTQTALTQVGAVLGTPAYMSPEQALGENTDWRTDIFSFGTILYEVVSGKRPFHGRNIMAIMNAVVNAGYETPPAVNPALTSLIQSCLVKDRAQRLQSIKEAVTILSPATSASIASAAVTRTPPRNRRWLILTAIAVVLGTTWSARHAIQSWLTVNAPSVVSPTAYSHYQIAAGLLAQQERLGNVDGAITELQKAITINPAYAPAHAGLADAYVAKNEGTPDPQWLRLARQSAERALSINPDLAVCHISLGRVALAQKELDLSRKELARAIELDPRRAEAHRILGALWRAVRDVPAAEKSYRTALDLDPNTWRTSFELGGLYYANSRFAEAAAVWQNASNKAPANDVLHRNLGAALHMLGRHEEAASELQKALEIAPSATTFNNLGNIRYFQGRYDDAVSAFEKAVDGRPGAYNFWGNLGDAYRWGTGTRPKATAAYSRAIQLARVAALAQPDDLDVRSRLALYLAKLGDSAAARTEIAALPAASQSSALWFRVAVAWELLRNREQALTALDRAITNGYSKNEIETEPELAPLRTDRRYHLRMATVDIPNTKLK